MKKAKSMMAAAAIAMTATGVWSLGLEEGFSAAGAAVKAGPKPASCWTRAEDREADLAGLPTMLCFAAQQQVFEVKPKAYITSSYSEGTCSESVWAVVEVSAPVAGELKIVAKIESTNDNCHSTPQSRELAYSKR